MPDATPARSVYVIGASFTGTVKIGIAANPKFRLASLQTGSPVRLCLLATFPCKDELEKYLHNYFDHRRIKGEWFDFGELNAVKEITRALANRTDLLLTAQPRMKPSRNVKSPKVKPGSLRDESIDRESVVRQVQSLYRDTEHFLPSEVILERLIENGESSWSALAPRAATMRLAWIMGHAGAERDRGYYAGRQSRGYRLSDIVLSA